MARNGLRERLREALERKPPLPMVFRDVTTGRLFRIEYVGVMDPNPELQGRIMVELRPE